MTDDFANRLRFHDELQTLEADFSDFHFCNSVTTNRFYDFIEDSIAASGHRYWFFLVNLHGLQIDPIAWPAYATRGKALNLAHSMGTVRFDASSETAARVASAAQTDHFDPNLFNCREEAIARLKKLPSRRGGGSGNLSNYGTDELVSRLSFDRATSVTEADFSNFTFYHSRDVDDFYDHIEARIGDSGQDKWFFLINYENCTIEPGAWVRFAHRGKLLNKAHSLGSVRFAPGSETEADIRMRAESQDFRPNIRNTRDEALARIAELRASEHA
ncbi:hypothetical protein [uncultured Pelagimonas sp.]|uniref:hypothetical protein n=1 Tax=uncultured Pelagimonas sp. TaxID=1618102 RepID=UPI00261A9A38|nr:hypothetical protein [uncultured Pelagimonas sp.]